jgi:hypothetical protein
MLVSLARSIETCWPLISSAEKIIMILYAKDNTVRSRYRQACIQCMLDPCLNHFPFFSPGIYFSRKNAKHRGAKFCGNYDPSFHQIDLFIHCTRISYCEIISYTCSADPDTQFMSLAFESEDLLV